MKNNCIECLQHDAYDLNAVFILLCLLLESEDDFKNLELEPVYSPEDLASWAKEADNYKGYLAWVLIYIKRRKDLAMDVLEELVEFYPENPEAYFKLWSTIKRDTDESLEIAERMFLSCTNFYMLETK